MTTNNYKNNIGKKLSKHQLRLASAFVMATILVNLCLSINDYRIRTIPINKFFYLQSHQHYTPAAKFTSNQPLRESVPKDKTSVNQYCDSCGLINFPLNKVITVERTIRYADIIPEN